MKIISANLDGEATWSGVTLPPAVRSRIAYYGTLAATLVDGEAEVWVPFGCPPRFHTKGPRDQGPNEVIDIAFGCVVHSGVANFGREGRSAALSSVDRDA